MADGTTTQSFEKVKDSEQQVIGYKSTVIENGKKSHFTL